MRHLYAATIRGAGVRSGLITGAEPAHGLEQQMIHTLIECLSTGPMTVDASMMHREREVMIRLEDLLQARLESDLSETEICTALEISDGLLRKCCVRARLFRLVRGVTFGHIAARTSRGACQCAIRRRGTAAELLAQ